MASPPVSHDPLHRFDGEAGVDIRPPAIERDFVLARWNRVMRHVIEPELTYRYVGGIGSSARDVLLADTTDIATNTNEAGYSLTQRLYLSPRDPKPCSNGNSEASGECPGRPREWASWTIAQNVFIDPNFGGVYPWPPQRLRLHAQHERCGVPYIAAEPRANYLAPAI